MAWKKIDDAQALLDMPYSSFLANGLTTNANSYNEAMTRGGGIAWNVEYGVTWSSAYEPQGFMFTVNVGQAVTEIEFRVTYLTLTSSVDADGFQGKVILQHIGGSEFVTVGLPPALSVAFLDITLPLNTAVSGPQAFSLTFQSSQLENLGQVDVKGGVENTIYLDEREGDTAYPITQGEKHELLSLSESQFEVTLTGPEDQRTIKYQINYISTNPPQPPDGFASVFPSVTSNPAQLNPSYNSTNIGAGTVFELGAMTLLGIAYNCTVATPGNAPSQFSHQTAAPLSTLIGIQNNARLDLQPDLCNGVSQRYALGAVIASATTFPVLPAVSTGFSFVTNSDVDDMTLVVTMSYYGLTRGGSPRIVLTLKDEAGLLVVPIVETFIPIIWDTLARSVVGITARGWYDPTAVAAWGMRDSMAQNEMMSGQTIAINVPNINFNTNKVYTVSLDMEPANTAIYVYNLYARLISNIGNEG